MRTVHVDEISFELPDDWVDRSIQIWADGPENRSAYNVVVTREPMGETPLRDFATAQLDTIAKQKPTMQVTHRRETKVGGLPAIEAKLRIATRQGMFYQRLACVDYYGTALLFTGACVMRLAPKLDDHLATLLASVKFRKI